jgi:hypothetical protein
LSPEQPNSSVAAIQTCSRPTRNAPSAKPERNFLDEFLIEDTPLLQRRPNEFEWTKQLRLQLEITGFEEIASFHHCCTETNYQHETT